ncbi:hypothetical protein [Nocardia sp. NRRL S-836]|uniref:hypothetical protein n=1 Tax=Nocardia sp. NRRL S-836 TaxID=1519492 RepID=UPI0006B012D1|nr:hypothetical protein [Nocardia sp. NRRL S-836]KOV84790.1 hypothetical protein ADL03_16125 [Nocardia sp. NRRL S-836]
MEVPVYSELQPLGPTTVGDVAGEFQLTASAYERTFARLLPHEMGETWLVVQAQYFGEYREVGNDDPGRDDDQMVFLSRRTQWFWCTDPHLPEATHFYCGTTLDRLAEVGRYDDDTFNAAPLDAAARKACAELNPASITWTGLPGDIFYGYGEPRSTTETALPEKGSP